MWTKEECLQMRVLLKQDEQVANLKLGGLKLSPKVSQVAEGNTFVGWSRVALVQSEAASRNQSADSVIKR